MTQFSAKRPLWPFLAFALFAIGLGVAPLPAGEPATAQFTAAAAALLQPPAPEEHPFLPHQSGRQIVGLFAPPNCATCHNAQAAGAAIPGIAGQVAGDWVLANELATWGKLDKHYQAYTVLLKERSQEMGRILGIVDADGNSQIHRDVRCLSCHSGMPLDQLNADEQGLVPAQLTQDRRLNLGVSCEGCHGAAGPRNGEQGWLFAHINPAQWRYQPPGEKWDKYGFYDVRSGISRTRMCASCHIGNARAGRVLTHEMYAAGHPPLPDFAVETFIDQEPPHWREFGMKAEAVRNDFLEKTGTQFNPDALHRTKKVLVGSLVNLSEYLNLTADLADPQVMLPIAKPEWPELAQFSCYACHHELETPAWRQQRGYWLVPGRPTPHEWPFALAPLAAQRSGQPPQQFTQQLQTLAKELNEQPFGTMQALPRAARAVAGWAEAAAERLDQQELKAADGRAILQSLADLAARQTLDYDSARQVVWAFAVIYNEVKRGGDVTPFSPKEDEIGWFPQRDGLDPVEEALANLDQELLLDLRKGRRTTATIPGENEPRPLLEVELNLVLEPIGKYQPERFKQRFAEIAKQLESPQTSP